MAEIIFSRCSQNFLARRGCSAREPLDVEVEEAEVIRSLRISAHRGNQRNGAGTACAATCLTTEAFEEGSAISSLTPESRIF